MCDANRTPSRRYSQPSPVVGLQQGAKNRVTPSELKPTGGANGMSVVIRICEWGNTVSACCISFRELDFHLLCSDSSAYARLGVGTGC